MQTLTLHDWHKALGATFTPEGRVARYGSVESEYRALRETAGLLDFSDREAIRVVGPDRDTFLHGMVTQDVTGLPVNSWAYTALTTAKGAMVGDARVFKMENALLLDTEPRSAEVIRDHLLHFLISEEAEVEMATGERRVLAVVGPKAKEVVQKVLALSPEGQRLAGESILALQHSLLGVISVELLIPANELKEVAEKLGQAGAAPVGEDAYQILRVEAGLPIMGKDMDHATIPLEANLERAISYQKGCYVGQEIIARATFRGHVNKKLSGLTFPDGAVAAGTELHHGEKRVGKVTSVAQSPVLGAIGMGYVFRTLLEPGTELLAEGRKAVVTPLPFPRS